MTVSSTFFSPANVVRLSVMWLPTSRATIRSPPRAGMRGTVCEGADGYSPRSLDSSGLPATNAGRDDSGLVGLGLGSAARLSWAFIPASTFLRSSRSCSALTYQAAPLKT
jgi:hypothetical protein